MTFDWQLLLRDGAILAALASIWIMGLLRYNPRLFLRHYPKEIREAATPLTAAERKTGRLVAIPFLAMLVGRRAENRDLFGPYGGDHGLVFPALSRGLPFRVQPVAEPKEYRRDPVTAKRVSILPGLHTLRRTYLSVAAEAGVSELDRHVLANHAYGRQNVNATYIEQAFDHLAACQAKIEAALWARLTPAPDRDAKPAKGRGRLRSV